MEKAAELLNASMKQFVLKLEKGDSAKIDVNAAFKTEALKDRSALTRIEAFLRKTASYNPALVPGMLNGMKAEQRKNFIPLFKNAMGEEKAKIQSWTPTTPVEREEKKQALDNLDVASKNFDRMILNNTLYGGAGRRGGGKTPPAAPAAPPAAGA
jgi:hypothetical protein